MVYAKLDVLTKNGWKTKHYKFPQKSYWKFGKFLLKYYHNKKYEWEEITGADNIQFLKILLGKKKFESIKEIK